MEWGAGIWGNDAALGSGCIAEQQRMSLKMRRGCDRSYHGGRGGVGLMGEALLGSCSGGLDERFG